MLPGTGIPPNPTVILTLTLTLTLVTQGQVKFRGRRLSVRLDVIFRPCGRKIALAQFATSVRPQGRTEVADWRYFPSLPTLIYQTESPNDIIIQTGPTKSRP